MTAAERRPWPRNPRYLATEDGHVIGPSGRALVGGCTPRGYRFVSVWPRGQRRTEYVHVIVCETFHGPRPAGMQAAHGNGDPADCRPTNLSWKTPVENNADKRRHGTHTRGEDHAPAKLTEQQAREILAACAAGESQRAVGARYGVTQGCVSMIVTRVNWAHL